MKRQLSFQNNIPTLFLVSTPIGNLQDMTFRAVETLKNVDIIFAEDTRVSLNLLKHYNIENKLSSYHEFNKESQGGTILNLLKEGKNIALISDAGMPVISDPGYEIAKEAMENDFNVVIIPGPTACLSALVVSGLEPKGSMYYGFLDSKDSKRRHELEELKDYKGTIMFYEAPHRIERTLKDIFSIFGDRKMALVRELTKKFEEVIRGNVSEIMDILPTLKGEMVIVIEGNKEEATFDNLTVVEHVNMYIKEGNAVNEAMKRVATDRNMKKQDIYKIYHEL